MIIHKTSFVKFWNSIYFSTDAISFEHSAWLYYTLKPARWKQLHTLVHPWGALIVGSWMFTFDNLPCQCLTDFYHFPAAVELAKQRHRLLLRCDACTSYWHDLLAHFLREAFPILFRVIQLRRRICTNCLITLPLAAKSLNVCPWALLETPDNAFFSPRGSNNMCVQLSVLGVFVLAPGEWTLRGVVAVDDYDPLIYLNFITLPPAAQAHLLTNFLSIKGCNWSLLPFLYRLSVLF